VFRYADSDRHAPAKHHRRPINCNDAKPRAAPINWTYETKQLALQFTEDRLDQLATTLGVTVDALKTLGVGWATAADLRRYGASGSGWKQSPPDGAFAFHEKNGDGRIVGVSLRTVNGRKGSPSKNQTGARRGLIVPTTWKDRRGPVLIVEGASDVAACEALKLRAVGRPSNTGGADHVAELLQGTGAIVIGENDAKPDGSWPGRKGAKSVATRIATKWNEPVPWALPPDGAKDLREYLARRVAEGLDLSDRGACKQAGAELLAALRANEREAKPGKAPPQSERLVQLALEHYRIGRTVDDEPFAVRLDGPNLVISFRGGRDEMRAELARRYRDAHGSVPNSAALTDAINALIGESLDASPETVHLRIADDTGRVIIDMGGRDGRAIVIERGKWEVVDSSPVLFRRTVLTGEISEPERGGDVEALRELLNVADESWPLLLGWLVAALIPEIDHPILMLGGMAGSGKSTAGEFLINIIDPSPAPRRSQPNDLEQWATAAAGSWGVLVDNVSTIRQWWSDALCKAVTGDGHVRRQLYTDSSLAVLRFRRVIAITSIDAGALQGDLGSRLLLVDLNVIDEAQRRSESKLKAEYLARRPAILGALLDIVACVLQKLETVDIQATDRLADFSRVLAAMDMVISTNALELYVGQRGHIADAVLDDDPVGAAVRDFMAMREVWQGTAGELLSEITPENPPRVWPKAANALSRRLNRIGPALCAVGVDVYRPAPSDKTRKFVLQNTARIAQVARDDASTRTAATDGESPAGDDRAMMMIYRPTYRLQAMRSGARMV